MSHFILYRGTIAIGLVVVFSPRSCVRDDAGKSEGRDRLMTVKSP